MIKPGNILIAKPYLQDTLFKRSVIYMVEHSQKESLGFIINKPNGLLFKDIFPHVKNGNFPLFEGGPVSNNQLYYTHTLGNKLSESIEIGNGVFWGGNFFELIQLIDNDEISANEIKFYIGYSGWGNRQLEGELINDMWLVNTTKYSNLMATSTEDLWGNELLKINKSYKAFADFNFDPSLN